MIDLRPDCGNCAALCCVALAFDRSRLFAFDKAAGQACPHLNDCGACTIHKERSEHGFAGCVTFDCLGAGQRATQYFAMDDDLRSNGAPKEPLRTAFGNLLRAHESLLLLKLSENLEIPHSKRKMLAELRKSLIDAGFDGRKIAIARSRIDIFLRSLNNYVSQRT